MKRNLKPLEDLQNRIMRNPGPYQRGQKMPPNLIMNIRAKHGQTTTALEYTNFMYENKIRTFRALDRMLEFRLDGSLNQCKQIFEYIIPNHSVYTNEFDGVIVFDISKLGQHSNEYQTEYFSEMIESMVKVL